MKSPITSITILGWIMAALSFAKNYFPDMPIDDVVALVAYLKTNWEIFANGIALVLILWGRLKKKDIALKAVPKLADFGR